MKRKRIKKVDHQLVATTDVNIYVKKVDKGLYICTTSATFEKNKHNKDEKV